MPSVNVSAGDEQGSDSAAYLRRDLGQIIQFP